MNPLKAMFLRIKNFFEADELTVIDNLNKEIKTNESEYSELQKEYDDLLAENKTLKEKVTVVVEYPEDIIKASETIKAEYPIANILYKGYGIKLKDSEMRPDVRVQDFIQVLNSHRKWVSDKHLTLQEYISATPKLALGEVINRLMFDIYKSYAPTKTYVTDSVLYGKDEQWSPTIDSWYLRKMDCENSTIELMALFEASGLSGELRNFYWNVCGQTSLGGHSTLYVWDFKNSVWRHIETTATRVMYNDFYGLPTNKDDSDQLRVTSVWFSFNSDVARHTFKTDTAKQSYYERQRFKDFIIR